MIFATDSKQSFARTENFEQVLTCWKYMHSLREHPGFHSDHHGLWWAFCFGALFILTPFFLAFCGGATSNYWYDCGADTITNCFSFAVVSVATFFWSPVTQCTVVPWIEAATDRPAGQTIVISSIKCTVFEWIIFFVAFALLAASFKP